MKKILNGFIAFVFCEVCIMIILYTCGIWASGELDFREWKESIRGGTALFFGFGSCLNFGGNVITKMVND